MSSERLDKILSHAGYGSRKTIRKLLRTCQVCVNGQQIFDPGFSLNTDIDTISIDGQFLQIRKNVYLMMNKPQNTVSANKDGLHQTVFDLLPQEFHTPYMEENLHLAGRLDVDTEGLLLFTTDGPLIHRITSPKTHAPKSYFVRLEKSESPERMEKITKDFASGLEIPPEGKESGALLKPASILWLNEKECILTISEGKFHQVKRMFLKEENQVIYLKRLTMGSLKLDENLKPGQWRELSQNEIKALTIE